MRNLKILTAMVLLLPLGGCAYSWLITYPKEIHRESHGNFTLRLHESPTSFFSPQLAFGSVHNNTTITVSVHQGDRLVQHSQFLDGEDRAAYHLPFRAVWFDRTVTVTESANLKSVTLNLPADDT